jgi:hypothetical protein
MRSAQGELLSCSLQVGSLIQQAPVVYNIREGPGFLPPQLHNNAASTGAMRDRLLASPNTPLCASDAALDLYSATTGFRARRGSGAYAGQVSQAHLKGAGAGAMLHQQDQQAGGPGANTLARMTSPGSPTRPAAVTGFAAGSTLDSGGIGAWSKRHYVPPHGNGEETAIALVRDTVGGGSQGRRLDADAGTYPMVAAIVRPEGGGRRGSITGSTRAVGAYSYALSSSSQDNGLVNPVITSAPSHASAPSAASTAPFGTSLGSPASRGLGSGGRTTHYESNLKGSGVSLGLRPDLQDRASTASGADGPFPGSPRIRRDQRTSLSFGFTTTYASSFQ